MAHFPAPTSTWHTDTYPSLSPKRAELSAKGKTVVVTGGGTGIGAETAHRFAEAGASRIALLGRREQPLLDTKASIEHKFAKVEVVVASTDVTDKSQVDAAFAKLIGNGKVHVLVSNAAMTGPHEPAKDVDADEFLRGIDDNLKGSLLVAQAFLRSATEDAVVIDINSAAAHINMTDGLTSYSVAKMAVFRLWDSLAYGNQSLRVFHIQPGVVDTDMNRGVGGVKAVGHADDGELKGGCSAKHLQADFDSLSARDLQRLARKS